MIRDDQLQVGMLTRYSGETHVGYYPEIKFVWLFYFVSPMMISWNLKTEDYSIRRKHFTYASHLTEI
jgi:hypothetical protein